MNINTNKVFFKLFFLFWLVDMNAPPPFGSAWHAAEEFDSYDEYSDKISTRNPSYI